MVVKLNVNIAANIYVGIQKELGAISLSWLHLRFWKSNILATAAFSRWLMMTEHFKHHWSFSHIIHKCPSYLH